jgi:hypothetical protein
MVIWGTLAAPPYVPGTTPVAFTEDAITDAPKDPAAMDAAGRFPVT